ncbi:MAG: hypothetical protein JNN15_14680 [Blastocatellia bacterium]|nr:hypothetical protein [Blastocatellia bacterium]
MVQPPIRKSYTDLVFEKERSQTRLLLHERSDSFPIGFSQSFLWLITSNNELKIVENSALSLSLHNFGKQQLEEIETAVAILEPQIAPIIFSDRVVIAGLRKLLSFTIHPHPNRWLQQKVELQLPENHQTLFNSEVFCSQTHFELPVTHSSQKQSSLLKLSYKTLLGEEPSTILSNSVDALLVGALDEQGDYFWAKDSLSGAGLIFYCNRSEPTPKLTQIACPPLRFLVKPSFFGQKLYAITSDNKLIEMVLVKNEVFQTRKLNQVERGARKLLATKERIIVSVQDRLVFFDIQTGEFISDATEIDTSHMFFDREGTLLTIHRNGHLIFFNPLNPLDRWGDRDATSDDSSVFDAFIVNNSLYTLSENGEVCRFDF